MSSAVGKGAGNYSHGITVLKRFLEFRKVMKMFYKCVHGLIVTENKSLCCCVELY